MARRPASISERCARFSVQVGNVWVGCSSSYRIVTSARAVDVSNRHECPRCRPYRIVTVGRWRACRIVTSARMVDVPNRHGGPVACIRIVTLVWRRQASDDSAGTSSATRDDSIGAWVRVRDDSVRTRCGGSVPGRRRRPTGWGVTALRHDGSMNPALVPLRLAVVGDVVGVHSCPSCEVPVERIHRPGRARIYCTAACRQRAYRWRRARGIRIFVERDGPAERSVNVHRHALRDRRDPVSRITDPRGREVTVCGTFAQPARHAPGTHDRFVPDLSWSCEVCTALIGVGDPLAGLPEASTRWIVPPMPARTPRPPLFPLARASPS